MNCEANKLFGETLTYTIEFYSIDIYDMARRYGLDNSTIRYWKLGRVRPRPTNFECLIGALDFYISSKCDENQDAQFKKGLSDVFTKLGYDNMDDKTNKCTGAKYAELALRSCYSGAKRKKEKMNETKIGNKIYKKTKAIVFDFDGTLTIEKTTKTTWETIWTSLGYSEIDCQILHEQYNRNEIDHPKWCELTEQAFKARELHKSCLVDIARKIKLISDIKPVFEFLRNKDIKIYIVSGSIKSVIQDSLGKLCHYVDEIKANEFIYDNGYLTKIVGTKYDFEGKANFIQETAERLNISPRNILFVGNSLNDRFAHTSGAKTLCINPRLTDPSDTKVWTDSVTSCTSLKKILEYIVE